MPYKKQSDRREADHRRYRANRSAILADRRAYYQANREELKRKARERYHRNKGWTK